MLNVLAPGLVSLSSFFTGLATVYSPRLNPNHETSNEPSLIFPRLGKMTPSGLLVVLGCSLGSSCHNSHYISHSAQCTHSSQPRPGLSMCRKAFSEKKRTWTNFQLLTEDTCPAGWARKSPMTPLLLYDSTAQPKWCCPRGVSTPLISVFRASPTQQV